MNKLVALILISFFTVLNSSAQEGESKRNRGEYSLVTYGGAGLSYYSIEPATPKYFKTDVSKISPAATFRLMWHPDHLLRIGIETGITGLYSYKINDVVNARISTSAIPLLLVWSMPAGNFNFFMGYGYYIKKSVLDFETVNKNQTFSRGWMGAINYIQPVSKNFGIGGELKWMNASETSDAVFSAQVMLSWKFFRW